MKLCSQQLVTAWWVDRLPSNVISHSKGLLDGSVDWSTYSTYGTVASNQHLSPTIFSHHCSSNFSLMGKTQYIRPIYKTSAQVFNSTTGFEGNCTSTGRVCLESSDREDKRYRPGLQLDRWRKWRRWCYPPEMHRCVAQFQVLVGEGRVWVEMKFEWMFPVWLQEGAAQTAEPQHHIDY